jgi:hypothetical protein
MAQSSSFPRGYLALQRSTVHPLIAFGLPTLFLLSLDALVRAVMPEVSFPPRAFSVVLPLAGIEEVIVANLLFVERAGRGARVRELLTVLAATWIALVLVRSIPAGRLIFVDVRFVYPLSLSVLEWTFVWVIHLRLREREILLSAIAGMRGEDLLHELRDASMQAAVTARGLAAVKVLGFLFQAAIFAMLLFCAAQGIRVGLLGMLLCSVNALLGLVAMGALSMFSEHQMYLGEGLVVPGRQERSRFVSMLIVLLACLPAAFLASRGRAPLPLSAILSLLERLLRRFPSIPLTGFADAAGRMVLQQQRYEAMLRAMPPAPLNPLFLLLLEFLRRLIPVLLLMTVYFFLVSPLLSEEFLESLRSRNPGVFLLEKLRRLALFCRRLLRGVRAFIRGSRKGRVPEEADRGHRSAWRGRHRTRRMSVRKRLQAGRVLNAFYRLIRWSESRGVTYRRAEAPQEYARRLLPIVPGMSTRLDLVVDVLEESLFSTHILEAGRLAAYLAAIDELRRSPVGQRG